MLWYLSKQFTTCLQRARVTEATPLVICQECIPRLDPPLGVVDEI